MEELLSELRTKTVTKFLSIEKIYKAKQELLEKCHQNPLELRANAIFVWNSFVRMNNLILQSNTADVGMKKLLAFGKELAYLLMREALLSFIDDDALLVAMNMACNCALSFYKIQDFGLVEQYLFDTIELSKKIGIPNNQQKQQVAENLTIYYTVKLLLTRGTNRLLEETCHEIKSKLDERAILAVIEHVQAEGTISDRIFVLEQLFLSDYSKKVLTAHVEMVVKESLIKACLQGKELTQCYKVWAQDDKVRNSQIGRIYACVIAIVNSNEQDCPTIPKDSTIKEVAEAVNYLVQMSIDPTELVKEYEKTMGSTNGFSDGQVLAYLTIKSKSWTERTEPHLIISLLEPFKRQIINSKVDFTSIEVVLYRQCRGWRKKEILEPVLDILKLLVEICKIDENQQKYLLLQAQILLQLDRVAELGNVVKSIKDSDLSHLLKMEIAIKSGNIKEAINFSSSEQARSLSFYMEACRIFYKADRQEEAIIPLEKGIELSEKDDPNQKIMLIVNLIIISSNLSSGHKWILKWLRELRRENVENDPRIINSLWNCSVGLFNAQDFENTKSIAYEAIKLSCKLDQSEGIAMFTSIFLEALIQEQSFEFDCDIVLEVCGQARKVLDDINLLKVILPAKRGRAKAGSVNVHEQLKESLNSRIMVAEALVSIRSRAESDSCDMISQCVDRQDECLELLAKKCLTCHNTLPISIQCTILKGLTDQVISDTGSLRIPSFAMLTRGMILMYLNDSQLEEASELCRQVSEVSKLVDEYPEDELLWLVATLFNVSQSLLHASEIKLAKEYCEICLHLVSSIKGGDERLSLEKQTRQGYAEIISAIE